MRVRIPIAALAATIAAAAGAQERLAPVRDASDATMAAYRTDLRRVLAGAYDRSVGLRAVVVPGFGAEYAVGLRQYEERYEIFSLQPSRRIWVYRLIADGTGGSDAALRDATRREIRRIEANLPADPTHLPLSRCAIAVDREAAALLLAAWRRMLEEVRPGDRPLSGAEGSSYRFSMAGGRRPLDGAVSWPRPGTRTGRLARLADAMRDHCAVRRPRSLRALLGIARHVVER
jgi:hypothetical protein